VFLQAGPAQHRVVLPACRQASLHTALRQEIVLKDVYTWPTYLSHSLFLVHCVTMLIVLLLRSDVSTK